MGLLCGIAVCRSRTLPVYIVLYTVTTRAEPTVGGVAVGLLCVGRGRFVFSFCLPLPGSAGHREAPRCLMDEHCGDFMRTGLYNIADFCAVCNAPATGVLYGYLCT